LFYVSSALSGLNGTCTLPSFVHRIDHDASITQQTKWRSHEKTDANAKQQTDRSACYAAPSGTANTAAAIRFAPFPSPTGGTQVAMRQWPDDNTTHCRRSRHRRLDVACNGPLPRTANVNRPAIRSPRTGHGETEMRPMRRHLAPELASRRNAE
jgi:hypothetical protein